jgi:predicted RND superfamily exporter protein
LRNLSSLVNCCVRFPKSIVFGTLAFALLSMASARSLDLKTSNLDLVDQGSAEIQRFLTFAANFGTPNALVIVLRGGSTAELEAAVGHVATKLRSTSGIRRVFDRIPSSLTKAISKPEYLHSRDGKQYYLFVQPQNIQTEVSVIAPLVANVEVVVRDAVGELSDITFGFTGIPRYSLDDQQVIQQDMAILSAVSLVLIALIFAFSFQSITRPLLAVVSLITSVAITMGIIVWYPGHLTLLSAPFAMMIFGLGIDYAIHIISLLERKIANGVPASRAIVESIVELRRSLLTACITTVAVLYSLICSDFLGFQELGFIAGTGIVICLLLTISFFPALLALFPSKNIAQCSSQNRLGGILVSMQRLSLAPVLFLLTVTVSFVAYPGFDANYLNLQPSTSESVRLEREMIDGSSYSPYFAAFTVDSLDEAASLAALLRSYPEIGEVRSITDAFAMPHFTEEDIRRIQNLPADQRPVIPELEIPPEYQGVFDSPNGQYAVYAYPAGNIWEPAVEQKFLNAVFEVDTEATGMPVIGNAMISKTKQALHDTGLYACIALVVLLFLDFKRPVLTLLAASTPLLTIVWLHASMRILGLQYNPLNIMALPIVLGIAVDDGVHLVHRYLIEKGDIKKTLLSSGRSVTLTTLTTLAAFACIAFTSHRGLRSFSILLSLGISIAFILSITLLPWLLVSLRTFIFPDKHRKHTA